MNKPCIISLALFLIFAITTMIVGYETQIREHTDCYDKFNNKIIGLECEQETFKYPLLTRTFAILTLIFMILSFMTALDFGDDYY